MIGFGQQSVWEKDVSQVKKTIGLMSGTSMDGIDVAYMETDGQDYVHCGATATFPYLVEFRNKLKSILGGQGAIAEVEVELTRLHARAVSEFLSQINKNPAAIDVIGFHGHTIAHAPTGNPAAPGKTWQIGDGQSLAQQTGISVVAGLRYADVAAGGQGAPLVPAYHAALVRDLPRPLAVVNVGGVANVTWVGADASLLAFDTGPGNGPIDDWCARRAGQRYDKDGTLAASGKVDRARLERFGEHRYFARTPPKSLDRGDFNDAWVEGLSVTDGAATLTRGTARAIALAARHFPAPVLQWVICGGGARNPRLLRAIAEETHGKVVTAADLGWDGDALEAQAFAFLAVRSLRGLPLTYPTTTGAPRPMTGGRLSEP